MERATKEELVADYKNIFQSAASGILIDYKGTTVEEITALRKTLYAKSSKMRVIKNTLAKIGATGTPCEPLADHFTGTRAFVYSDEDVVAPAKIITETLKKNEKFKLVAGVLVSDERGQLLDAAGVEALGNLPSKEDLLVKLLYVMNAPVTNFVRLLNEIPSSFVRVLKSIADSKE